MTSDEKHVLELFRRRLADDLGHELDQVLVFGSKARGDDRPDSDIDVLVVCKSADWHLADRVYRIATDVMLSEDVVISPKIISTEQHDEMRQDKVPFLLNIVRDGVPI